MKHFTFRQNHICGFIERRVDFFLISNVLQESIIKTDVLASFCTDHSPILFSLQQFFLKNMQFQYRQIIHALPQHWKEIIKQFAGNLNNLYIQDHHLIKCNTIYNLEKLNSKELYLMQLFLKYDKPTCQIYHEKNFE